LIVRQFLDWVETAPAGRRGEAAFALGRALLMAGVDDPSRDAMEAAVTVLVEHPQADVRLALAYALCGETTAPRHIIAALATDQVNVAAVVLARSPLFLDAELIAAITDGAPALRLAIAARPGVSPAVSAALAAADDREVCLALLANPSAAIDRATFRHIVERYAADGAVADQVRARADLPVEVHQMLVRRLADLLGGLAVSRAWLGEARAGQITREACDRATVAMAAAADAAALPALVEHLRATGQLTTALLLRAVCAGNLVFFEVALAALAGVPAERVAALVRGGRLNALRAVYDKAGLPRLAFDAFAVALGTFRRVAEGEVAAGGRYGVTRRVAEAVLDRYGPDADQEAMELAAMLRRIADDQAREAAHDYVRASAA
jgi:uncharacterized protein (DUF2336 family)